MIRPMIACSILIFVITGCDVLIGDVPCCGPATPTAAPTQLLPDAKPNLTRALKPSLPPRATELPPPPTPSPFVKPPLPTKPAVNATPPPIPAGAAKTYSVTNPTTNAKLHAQVFAPQDAAGKKYPALVLVPGGIGDGSAFGDDARRMASAGIVAVTFDPDGRGKSTGQEDYNGYKQQDGLAAVIRFVATLPEVDAARIGVATYSYGITMGSGALARHSDLPVKFLIDWEGPADHNYTTTGCDASRPSRIQWQPCSDKAWWAEREAVNFIGALRVPYQRIQSEKDHVQPTNAHAVDLINAAIKGGAPWVRLNDYPPNQTYDPNAPPPMLPEQMDRQLAPTVIRYAHELFGSSRTK